MVRRWRAALGLAAALLAGACTPAKTPAPSTAASAPSTADGIGRVASAADARHAGALFRSGRGPFCSGSVVRGGRVDLVVTAAHCVVPGPGAAPRADLEYAPAYQRGAAPYGRWKVVGVTVDPRWTDRGDPDLDVAFLELAPRDGRLSDVVGAQRIAFDVPSRGAVRLVGYPDVAADPLACLGTMTAQSATQRRVGCTGYRTGTSGSPWLVDVDPAGRTGTVVGVIGGYQQGGDTDDVSYSPYFGADVQRLFRRAVRA